MHSDPVLNTKSQRIMRYWPMLHRDMCCLSIYSRPCSWMRYGPVPTDFRFSKWNSQISADNCPHTLASHLCHHNQLSEWQCICLYLEFFYQYDKHNQRVLDSQVFSVVALITTSLLLVSSGRLTKYIRFCHCIGDHIEHPYKSMSKICWPNREMASFADTFFFVLIACMII